MDALIDKRAELAYLMTLRDEANYLHEKLQALLLHIQHLEQQATGKHQ